MALVAVRTGMTLDEEKSIHPLFSKTPKNTSLSYQPSSTKAPPDASQDDPDYEGLETGGQPLRGRKKRGRKPETMRVRKEAGSASKNQASLDGFACSLKVVAAEQTNADIPEKPGECEGLVDPSRDRRKRRRTGSPYSTLVESICPDADQMPQSLDWHRQLQIEADRASNGDTESSVAISNNISSKQPEAKVADSARPVTPERFHLLEAVQVPLSVGNVPKSPQDSTLKKRQLKVNKNGKLLSSPLAKPEPELNSLPKRRRMGLEKDKSRSFLIKIRYGHTDASKLAIGEKIEAIFSGRKPAQRPTTPKNVQSKPTGPPRPTHPFFLGKTQKKDEARSISSISGPAAPPSPKTLRKTAVTPGKLKAESRNHHSTVPEPPSAGLALGNRMAKLGGIDEAPWPSRDTAHVRNLSATSVAVPVATALGEPALKARKMKANVFAVPHGEDLLTILARQLCSTIHYQPVVNDSAFEPPTDVRLPARLLTTGLDIQDRVRGQVRVQVPNALSDTTQSVAHPAIGTLFDQIEYTLTPFDLGTCESQTWTQKYAPQSAPHVLQAGKEAAVFRDWLESSTIMAVKGGQHAMKPGVSATKGPPKKKRKKTDQDFIVDSDEDLDEEMVEISNHGSQPSLRRAQWSRNKNVVLLSGPHGCGKSATVYAVAKELGFDVFEINSGSRRSGRDIQDKVGDMSENHLVNQKRTEPSAKQGMTQADDTDNERMTKAVQKDLECGRQGMMTSFFKSSSTAKPKSKAKVKGQESTKVLKSAQPTLPIIQPQQKSQKQSLILFEEADILFEEDQQFWAYVTKLAAQSKRPIVITCNDETLIPTHELPLAAILRLSPPPVDLATDYLLTMAAREGHLLQRDAISDLYLSKNCDLRSSITELNFWCQMAVGDRKGGLEWMYQRWPPGKDIDAHGRLLRVASEGTYQSGMGWFSHNAFIASKNAGFDNEHELLKETWTDWSIDPHQWDTPSDGGQSATQAPKGMHTSLLEDLKRLDSLSDSVSAADVYCNVDMPSYEHAWDQPTDPSLPLRPNKERLNYTLAAPVIQVEHTTDFIEFDTDMYIQSHVLIHRTYDGHKTTEAGANHLLPTTEHEFSQAILRQKEEQQQKRHLSWPDFSTAFDLLAYIPDTLPAMNTSFNLTASSFDRTFRIVVEDLAPYVRSIVAYELILEAQRIRLGNLLSEGGKTNRPRTTRAARVALEGGDRKSKRRDKWFDKNLNRTLVMATAGKSWAGLGSGAEEVEMSTKTGESPSGTQE